MCQCLNWVFPVSNDPRLRVREGDLYGRNQDHEGRAVLAAETIGSGGGALGSTCRWGQVQKTRLMNCR